MRNLVIVTVFLFGAFSSCKQDDLKSASVNCTPFVNLNYFNYDSLKRDPIFLEEYKINGDCLELTFSYGGCTQDHAIDLAFIQPECGTPPLPPPTFEIRHNSNGELCKMLVTETRKFDLTPLQNPDSTKISFIVSYPIDESNFKSVSLEYRY
jgi:hypothetical protein